MITQQFKNLIEKQADGTQYIMYINQSGKRVFGTKRNKRADIDTTNCIGCESNNKNFSIDMDGKFTVNLSNGFKAKAYPIELHI